MKVHMQDVRCTSVTPVLTTDDPSRVTCLGCSHIIRVRGTSKYKTTTRYRRRAAAKKAALV